MRYNPQMSDFAVACSLQAYCLTPEGLIHPSAWMSEIPPTSGFEVRRFCQYERRRKACKEVAVVLPQVPSEPSPVAAGAFYTGALDGAEALCPAEESLLTLRARRHAGLAQASAQMVDSYRYMEVQVRVHAHDHHALGGLRPLGADGRSVPIPFRCRPHFTTRGMGENGQYCERSRQKRAPMRLTIVLQPRASGRRVTPKASLAHMERGSDRSETPPTAILHDTHSVEGLFSANFALTAFS
jgi:hypothetical protein